jgi:hypothetical protein
MQQAVSYILIVLGIVWIVLSVLMYFGVIGPTGAMALAQQAAGPWDVLNALLEKLPWLAVVGLIQIYAGIKLIGAKLPE